MNWSLTPSMPLELDMLLAAVSGYYPLNSLPAEMAQLIAALPRDWAAELGGLPREAGQLLGVLEIAGSLAGVLEEGDYSRATMAMRALTAAEALARVQARAARGREASAAALTGAGERGGYEASTPSTASTGAREPGEGRGAEDPVEALAAELAREQAELFGGLGFPEEGSATLARRAAAAGRIAARIVSGGDLHAAFWHWLDRLYYEFYGPWRRERTEVMAKAEERGRVVLGTGAADGGADGAGEGAPPLGWLPAQSPLLRLPELAAAAEAGRLRVRFWIEPFGLTDFWSLTRAADGQPLLVTAFAEAGPLLENFRAATIDLAARAAALADPTRLTILRMIRNFGMVNTEIAAYLGLARPTVSIHAKILREAGLIRSHAEGRLVRHEIVPEEVRRLFRDLERFLDLPADE